MIVIFRGSGILVPLITAGCLVGADYVTARSHGPGYYAAHTLPKLVSFTLAAVLIFALARLADREGREDDHFFFVPVRFWSAILLIAGVCFSLATTDSTTKTANASPPSPPSEPLPAPAAPASTPPSRPASFVSIQETQPVTTTAAQPAPDAPPPRFEQVYIDRATNQYYSEKCAHRPDGAYRTAKSAAVRQGYTEAACQ
jgi:hypothetical protein